MSIALWIVGALAAVAWVLFACLWPVANRASDSYGVGVLMFFVGAAAVLLSLIWLVLWWLS